MPEVAEVAEVVLHRGGEKMAAAVPQELLEADMDMDMDMDTDTDTAADIEGVIVPADKGLPIRKGSLNGFQDTLGDHVIFESSIIDYYKDDEYVLYMISNVPERYLMENTRVISPLMGSPIYGDVLVVREHEGTLLDITLEMAEDFLHHLINEVQH